MNRTIVVASGKGGTGKTFISTNLARTLELMDTEVHYLDCDVEAPDGHLFLKPEIEKNEEVILLSPGGVDPEKCTFCGECARQCRYNAIACVNQQVLFFQTQCHLCGACRIACPQNAIVDKERKIGELKHGYSGRLSVHYGVLQPGEGGMTPRLIKKVKEHRGGGINILDSPPGTACPSRETLKNSDLCVLVTDPTPFGINDLKLAVKMSRKMNMEPVIIINRADSRDRELKEFCEKEKLEIIGKIPDDRKIAEAYSTGKMVVTALPEYYPLFSEIAIKLIKRSREKREIIKTEDNESPAERIAAAPSPAPPPSGSHAREVVVISGKGGTGKTSLTAAFCALEGDVAVSDCDVDAADLHIILNHQVKEKGNFYGGEEAQINPEKCTNCGDCYQACGFGAIEKVSGKTGISFKVTEEECEGCGACALVCPSGAIELSPALTGEWYISQTPFGPLSHAQLETGAENSGKLVTLVRDHMNNQAARHNSPLALSDGSPGIGCPVIASITGAGYVVVVTEPTVSGIYDLSRVLDLIDFFKLPAGIIVNKGDLNLLKLEEIKALAKTRGVHFHGSIPYDPAFTEAQMKGMSVVESEDNQVAREVKKAWNHIKEVLKKL